MPLPVLDHIIFEPTGQILSPSDYFNPTINTNFAPAARGSNGYNNLISLSDYCKIGNALCTPESKDDICTLLTKFQGDAVYLKQVFETIYDAIPENYRYLLFNLAFNAVRENSNRTYTFNARFLFPIDVIYNEPIRDQKKIDFAISFQDRNDPTSFSLTDEQKAHIANVITRESLEGIDNYYGRLADRVINTNDGVIGSLIRIIYNYSNNKQCYYPTGDRDSFPGSWDWTTPKLISEYIADGYTVTFSFTSNKLLFRVLPKPGDRRPFERLMNYSANVFNSLPYTISGEREPSAPLYGVELEANGEYTVTDLIRAQKYMFFICKADSSIYGAYANNYELVTVPASLKAHKRLWAEFFEKVDYAKFDTSKETGNGMHVHISRDAFSKEHLNRLTWFITDPANFDFILAVSERPSAKNLQEWARTPVYSSPSRCYASRNATHTNRDLRGAIHYKGSATVEIRIFKGIVSYATIVKNLEFVDSAYEFTRVTGLSQVSVHNYLSWLFATPKNKYVMLKTFFQELRVEDLIYISRLNAYIFGLSNDSQIADKLNKAPFKVTSAMITYLNKKRRKRTFVLKDGKVTCTFRNGGLLAKLDKSAQQKQTRGAATFTTTSFAS